MDVKNLSPFIEAVANVVPPLGFQNITRQGYRLNNDKIIQNKGVIVIIELYGMLKGFVFYNFSKEAAENIARKMILQASIPEYKIDLPLMQSAIKELGNMLSANSSIILETYGITIDISIPKLTHSDVRIPSNIKNKHVVVDLTVDSNDLEINLLIQKTV